MTETEPSDVWEVNGKVIVHLPDGTTKEHDGELDAKKLKEYVRAVGTRKFTVKKDGEPLETEDFPVNSCHVFVEEYNEAKLGL